MKPTELVDFLRKKYDFSCEESYAAFLIIRHMDELRLLRKNRHFWKTKAINFEKQSIYLTEELRKAQEK